MITALAVKAFRSEGYSKRVECPGAARWLPLRYGYLVTWAFGPSVQRDARSIRLHGLPA